MSEWCSVCKDRPRLAGSKVCGRESCDQNYIQGSKELACGCLVVWGVLVGLFAFLAGLFLRGCGT